MKKIQALTFFFTLLLLLAINPFCAAQSNKIVEDIGKTYKVINDDNYADLNDYIKALNNADLHHFRLRTKSFTLNFENGISFEIFSAEYLQSKGIEIGFLGSYPEDFSAERYFSVFQITNNGVILEARAISINKKTAR